MQGCKWLPGGLGSFGVILVDLPEGVVVVKCAGAQWVPEYVGHVVTRAASLSCPAMRLLERHSEEADLFWESITHAPFTNAHDAQRLSQYTPYSTFYVMEYVPQASSLIMSTDQAQRLLGEPTRSGVWESMARTMALDVLMNNYDRMPLVWGNEGNPSNVLVRHLDTDHPQWVCIDQMVTEVSAPYYPAYEATVQHLARALVSSCSLPGDRVSEEAEPLMERVSRFFETNLQMALSPGQKHALCGSLRVELESLCVWATGGALDDLCPSHSECQSALLFVKQVAHSCLVALKGATRVA